MTRVLLIRHGETPWNRERRWQGHADIALSSLGIEQAERLARYLKDRGPHLRAIHSSDLSRARDTALRIAAETRAEVVLDPAWREMHVGLWTGLSREEIQSRFPNEWASLAAGEDLPRGGGETFADFRRRVVGALESLPDRAGSEETVAVVTHGGVIRAALLHALGLPMARLREITFVLNTAVTELRRGAAGWEVGQSNQVPHLEEAVA